MKLFSKINILRQVCLRRACLRQVCFRRVCRFVLIINLAIIGILGLFPCWWILKHTQLHLCLTPSLEGIRALLFYKTSPQEIKRGDIVAIQGHVYKYLGIKPYAKRAIGFPGDSIIREKNIIKIGSRILSLVEKTHEGQPLTPTTLHVVPEGYLFVAGDHPRSIDSRYEEFGVVKEENIWGKACLKW